MTWINHVYFTQRWLERAERNNVVVDKGDKFISLWIAFNGWMKGNFGENKTDKNLIDEVKALGDMKDVFSDLQKSNTRFMNNLKKLEKRPVVDMRDINNVNKTKRYDGTFESLIDVIYQIRCNLFHGRKDTREAKKDFELICLSYDILLPLFKKYLGEYGHYIGSRQ